MFCPGCGLEDIQANQFCRSCGTELSVVRNALERPDSITDSAASARVEIGKAIATKIKQADTPKKLTTITEEVLPEIERFLESPEERKLRRIRVGSTVSFIGFGVMVGFFIASIIGEEEVIFLAALGAVTFFIGLSLLINGMFFTVPKKQLTEGNISNDKNQASELNSNKADLLMPPTAQTEYRSVTENTTRNLKKER